MRPLHTSYAKVVLVSIPNSSIIRPSTANREMNTMTRTETETFVKLREISFKAIQEDETLWKEWNEAKDQSERELLITESIYKIAYLHGFEDAMNGKFTEKDK